MQSWVVVEKADRRPCLRICPPDNYIIAKAGHEGRIGAAECSVSRQFGQTPLIGPPAACQAALFGVNFLGKHWKRLAGFYHKGSQSGLSWIFHHFQHHQHLLQHVSKSKTKLKNFIRIFLSLKPSLMRREVGVAHQVQMCTLKCNCTFSRFRHHT